MLVPRFGERPDPFEESQPLQLLAKDLINEINTETVDFENGQQAGTGIVPGIDFLSGGQGTSPSASTGQLGLLLQQDNKQAEPVLGVVDAEGSFPRARIPGQEERPVKDMRQARIQALIGLAGLGAAGIGGLTGSDFLVSAGAGTVAGAEDLMLRSEEQLRADQSDFDKRKTELEDFNLAQEVAEAKLRIGIEAENRQAFRTSSRQAQQLKAIRDRMLEIEQVRALRDLGLEQEKGRQKIALRKEEVENPSLGERASFMNAQTSAANARLNRAKNAEAAGAQELVDTPSVLGVMEIESEIGLLEDAMGTAEARDKVNMLKSMRELRQQRDLMFKNLQPGQLRQLERLKMLEDDAAKLGMPVPFIDPGNPNEIVLPQLDALKNENRPGAGANNISEQDVERMRQMVERGEMPPEEFQAVMQVLGVNQ